MCGVWCMVSICPPFWLKFKWRIVEAWNVEPPPPTPDSRFGGLLHLPHSPLLQLHPLAASSTSGDFASIPHIPFSHPSTLPPLQPPCLLHFASTPYIPLSHPSTLPPLQSPCLVHFASAPYITSSIHPHLPLVRHHGRLLRRPPLRPRRGAGREVRVERRVVKVFAAAPPPPPPPPKSRALSPHDRLSTPRRPPPPAPRPRRYLAGYQIP